QHWSPLAQKGLLGGAQHRLWQVVLCHSVQLALLPLVQPHGRVRGVAIVALKDILSFTRDLWLLVDAVERPLHKIDAVTLFRSFERTDDDAFEDIDRSQEVGASSQAGNREVLLWLRGERSAKLTTKEDCLLG